MYKSIPEDLSNQELTTVIHFVVKMLNKYKSAQNRQTKIGDLPIRPEPRLAEICENLLSEIKIAEINQQDEKIDMHIQALFKVLTDRLQSEIDRVSTKGKELLDFFNKKP